MKLKSANKNEVLSGDIMLVDEKKLKNASIEDILKELETITEELSNQMYPPSAARTTALYTYKKRLLEELKTRQ